MPHKVGSWKSPGRVDLLRTSAGDILYPTNIISVGLLTKDGYNLSIKNDYCDIIMNNVIIM